MTELQTEAEEKRRADEIKVQMAKIEADKELALKEMELQAQQAQAQVTASSATTPPRPSYIEHSLCFYNQSVCNS